MWISVAGMAVVSTAIIAVTLTRRRLCRRLLRRLMRRRRGNWRVVVKWPPGFVGWYVERTPSLQYRYG